MRKRSLRVVLPFLLALFGLLVPQLARATPGSQQLLWRFDGQGLNDLQGTSVAGVRDVNGDGVADVVTGLWTVPTAQQGNKVSVRVYSGASGQLLWTVAAPAQQSHGSSNPVASLGDLTGDGRAELLVGTPGAQVGAALKAGVARVYSANGALLGTLTQPGGPQQAAEFGASVAFAGDVDNDGRRDLIVGAPGGDAAYVFSGNPGAGFPLIATLADGSMERTRFGASVGRVGNVNGTRGDEVIVGAPYNTVTANRSGSAFVIAAFPAVSVVRLVHGDAAFNLLGVDVDGGRDLSGDGVPDFVVGAMGTDSAGPKGTGFVRIYSGSDGTVMRTISSDQQGDLFGLAVSLSDPCGGARVGLIVGAPQAVNPGNGKIAGRVLAYDPTSGAQLTQIFGESSGDALGIAVGGVGDLNGDGRAEFVAGAQGMDAPNNLPATGAALVYSCELLARPDLAVSPPALDLGTVTVGGATTLVLTLTNQGDALLNVTGISLLAGSGAFSVSGNGFVLAPGASQAVNVQFNPTQAAVSGGVLRIQSNDPDTPALDVPLSGKGVQAAIKVTPTTAGFGNVDVGDSAWAAVKVENVGNQLLTVTGVSLAPDGSGDFSLAGVPTLPKTLLPGQSFSFQALLNVSGQGPRGATLLVASNAATTPSVAVPLSATGVAANRRPTAVIKMDVPYSNNARTIQFRGDGSFDPDGTIAAYQWSFGDGGSSTAANPVHTFICGSGVTPCRYVVRLTVTDNGGKQDPTSITAIVSLRDLRSRFYGRIRQGGVDVPEGTIIEAWVERNGQRVKVAESAVQNHLGRSVYAIEVPPEIGPASPIEGGQDGEQVFFRYRLAYATSTGTWYDATDQELNLDAPFYVPPRSNRERWCMLAKALGLEVCGKRTQTLPNGLNIALQEVLRNPIPNSGLLRFVRGFELTFSDPTTGATISRFAEPYQITISYTDAELRAAGVSDERTLGLYYLEAGVWRRAGIDVLDPAQNRLVVTLDHASIFALQGGQDRLRIYLPVVQR